MKSAGIIWQIVPRAPGSREGVGDYAQILATHLEQAHGYETIFVTGAALAEARSSEPPAAAIVLHYVNYGYHSRGVPVRLLQQLRRLQGYSGAKLITIFHELSAAGTWRQSAFWLRPLQQRIARAIAESSATCLVSSPALGEQLQQLSPASRIIVRPVFSNFGEPQLSTAQISGRDFARWIICGGSELVERSLRAFLRLAHGASDLFVVGGADRAEIRRLLQTAAGVATHYLPDVEAAVASETLASCGFGWINYFEHVNAPTAAILKSTAFAAYCAHGVIPVLPVGGGTIAVGDDALPGPFSLESLPNEAERPQVARAVYDWYRRHASSRHLAATVAAEIAA